MGRPHAVCVPFPAQGHLIPMMQLSKLLHSKGFFITFVNTEFNHRRLVRSKGPDWVDGFTNFRFEAIPEGLPPSDRNATQDPAALCDSIRKNCSAPFRNLLTKINSSEEFPPVTCVVADGVMSFAIKAGEEVGVPVFQFWTASACGFMGYLQYRELVQRGIVPFKDENFKDDGTLDTPIDWIPGMRNIRLKDLPSFVRTTDPKDVLFNYLADEVQNCLKSSAIIFNTFTELERDVLQSIASFFPKIYTVGPLSSLALADADADADADAPNSQLNSFKPNLWREDADCLRWLDEQEPSSVVYVNYGSVTLISDQHLKEFAWGLAHSNRPFLWIVRADLVRGEGETTILPTEFLEETNGRGIVTTWCPQDRVLTHPSIAVFLTHCGWNSTLEAICGGVPVICWPFFAEQQTNCRYACVEWGIGAEISNDVKREEIKKLVDEMVGGERGRRMREKAKEWKKKAEEAVGVGGTSHNDFNLFIEAILQGRK